MSSASFFLYVLLDEDAEQSIIVYSLPPFIIRIEKGNPRWIENYPKACVPRNLLKKISGI